MQQDKDQQASEQCGGRSQARSAYVQPYGNSGLLSQLSMMFGAFMATRMRNRLIALAFSIFILVVIIAVAQVAINRWNEPFYDALSRRDMQGFLYQLRCSLLLPAACWCSMSRRHGST